ncbi:MAG: hypothetical protein ABSF98_03660 [Bryobacteraceae bacterium]
MPRTWWQGLALGLALLAAVSALFIFGYRAARHARYLRWEDQPIHPWMSVPFVAHTHHVPREILFAAIGIEPREHDRRPLRTIARQQKRPVEDVIRDLEKAIAKERAKAPAVSP